MRYSRNRPSGDQSIALLTYDGEVTTGSSSSPPVTDFQTSSIGPRRPEPNTMRLPSGDHNGRTPSHGLDVKRTKVPLSSWSNQMPLVPETTRWTANCRPSGEAARLNILP